MQHAIRVRVAGGALALAATAGLLAITAGQQVGATQQPAAKAGIKAKAVKDIRGALARRGVTVKGKPVRAVVFDDANGRNLVVLSRTEGRGAPLPDEPYTRTARIYADHFATRNGHTRKLRAVRDGVINCWADLTAELQRATPKVTDLDGDRVGEVLFAYQLACRSDASPAELKLLMLENGRKYIVRGETWSFANAPGQPRLKFGKPEPAWSRWPAPFAGHAKRAYHHWTILR
jgi:hypothetical protein